MIEIKDISKRFDDTVALNRVSLEVKNGSILGLVGSNGAGKSTLLRILAGIYKADSGQTLFDGVPSWNNSAVKGQIVFISDYPYFSSSDTLASLAKTYRLLYPNWSNEAYTYFKGLFPLDERMKINKMSKGMQRQAALVLGLSARPQYLLFDEIFDGLDPVIRELVKRILIDFAAQNNAGVIIASHNLRELEDVCDAVCLIHAGGIIADADVDELKLGITKLHVIFQAPEDIEKIRAAYPVLKMQQRGKITELTLRGDREEIMRFIDALSPAFADLLPLSLEEVFISEMEVSGYEIKSILAQS